MPSSRDVTALLLDWTRGDRHVFDRLLPLVYDELRRIAARQLRRERAGHTLQPTALVHEAMAHSISRRTLIRSIGATVGAAAGTHLLAQAPATSPG